MPFDDHLRPQKHGKRALSKFFQNFHGAVFPARGIQIETHDFESRQQFLQLLFDALRPAPQIRDVLALAFRAAARHAIHAFAIMTAQLMPRFVIDQGNIAIRAFEDVAAILTTERRGVPAAIQKQNRLLSFLRILGNSRQQLARIQTFVSVSGLVLHVDDGKFRKRRLFYAMRHLHQIDGARLGCRIRRDGRRRRAEQNGTAENRRQFLRRVPRIVKRRLILLVRRIVFLVDDDESQILKRKKQRRARSNCNVALPRPDALPIVVALPFRQFAVNKNDIIAETLGKIIHYLRRERDFRHEKQHTAAERPCVFRGAQIHFRLAAPRHAHQKLPPIRVGIDGRLHRLIRGRLLLRQLARRLRHPLSNQGIRRLFFVKKRNRTLFDAFFEHELRETVRQNFRFPHRLLRSHKSHELLLPFRQLRRIRFRRSILSFNRHPVDRFRDFHPLQKSVLRVSRKRVSENHLRIFFGKFLDGCIEERADGMSLRNDFPSDSITRRNLDSFFVDEKEPQRVDLRAKIIPRNPIRQREHLRREPRKFIHGRDDILHFILDLFLLAHGQHDAFLRVRTERNRDAPPDANRPVVRNAIRKRPIQILRRTID